jgi:hypothetical protein
MQSFFTVALPLLATVTTSTATLPFFNYKMQGPPPPVPGQAPFSVIKEFDLVDEKKTAIREVAPEKPKEKRLICKGCNEYENKTLNFLQDRGIKDKYALATVMGNIRQESTFVPNICEGGARTSYRGCRSGGFGIIQWTSSNRYHGLGDFAARYGGNPSTLDTQLHYMINETQWKDIEHKLKQPGNSIHHYMRLAHNWLGWGHHGARTSYAYDYASRLILTEV